MSEETEARGAARGWGVVLGAGLLAGTLDLVYARVFRGLEAGVRPQRILQSVAAGLLGPASFEGGLARGASRRS